MLGHLAGAAGDDVLMALAARLGVVGRAEAVGDGLDLFEDEPVVVERPQRHDVVLVERVERLGPAGSMPLVRPSNPVGASVTMALALSAPAAGPSALTGLPVRVSRSRRRSSARVSCCASCVATAAMVAAASSKPRVRRADLFTESFMVSTFRGQEGHDTATPRGRH